MPKPNEAGKVGRGGVTETFVGLPAEADQRVKATQRVPIIA